MSFLTPLTAAVAAAIAVPLLLLLYFLKLRRVSMPISSTLLWKRAVQDLQVNAPFQKLRRNLLLFLQLIVLALVLLSLGTPMAKWLQRQGQKVILLIDQSASMNTREQGATRMDLVRQAAANYLRGLSPQDEVMLIAFSGDARVVSQFTRDHAAVQRAVDRIETTDGPSRLGEALQLAVAYSAPTRIEPVPGAQPAPTAQIELFSDGRIADADAQVIQRGQLRLFAVGEADDNVGIVAVDVRRNYEKPADLTVFAQIENFSHVPVKADVRLLLNGRDLHVKELNLGAAAAETGAATRPTASRAAEDADPASRAVVFEFSHDAGGMLELRIDREDALDVDNIVRMPIDPPRRPSVLLVSDRDRVIQLIERALRGMSVERIDTMGTREYDEAPDDKLIADGRAVYDTIVVDNHTTARLPPSGFVFFGGAPVLPDVSLGDVIENEQIVAWDETHPLMKYVSFDNVGIVRWRKLTLPRQAAVLVESEHSPVIAYLPTPGRQFVICAFDLAESDWWRKIPFVVFLFNATRFFAAGDAGTLTHMLRPGETIIAPPIKNSGAVDVLRPDANRERIEVAAGRVPTYARTERVGVYDFSGEDDSFRAAVNLLDRNESRIAPNPQFAVGGERVARVESDLAVNQPLWPYLILAAIAVLLFEWWIYNRRVML